MLKSEYFILPSFYQLKNVQLKLNAVPPWPNYNFLTMKR